MRTSAGVIGLAVAVVLAVAGCSTLHKSDSSALQGTWKGQEAGRFTAGTCCLIISGNTLEFRGANTNEWYKGTFTLREDQNPKQLIGVVTECPAPQYIGKPAYAIYKIEAGTLTLTGSEPGKGDVPTSFDASNSRRFVLRKS